MLSPEGRLAPAVFSFVIPTIQQMRSSNNSSGGKPPFPTEHVSRRRVSGSPRLRVSRSRRPPVPLRIGVDTGGTFTDFVFELNGRREIFKLPSTPSDPSIAITNGLHRILELIGAEKNFEVVHGTTVGTNALLQRRGARTALITTKGFEDVLVIGRQARPELYNLDAIRPPPLVPDDLRFGLPERVAATGDVLEALDSVQLREIIAQLTKANVESVAVSLLFSFANSQHEKEIAAALAVLQLPLSISHQILPEYREYERTSTVTINAFLQPLMGKYLNRLIQGFSRSARPKHNQRQKTKNQKPRLRVMQSSGGSISAAAAAAEPVRTILSGPAGGIVGALEVSRATGFADIISFDMGGTSTDVALCEREGLRTTNEAIIAGLPVAVSVLDIHTVGAGGGSIARVDEGGSLRVGPESAGADPGPACYGRSLLPTVTDAHVVLNHFGGSGLLGGEFLLDETRAISAMSELAEAMSGAAGRTIRAHEAAQGVVAVVNSHMERALRLISVERGYDPRDFSLVPFGGAGGLHAVDLAQALGIPRVIVPVSPGALSAIGVAAANVVMDQSQTVMLKYGEPSVKPKLELLLRKMERTGRAKLRQEAFADDRQRHERSLAMRYEGQSFELEIKFDANDLAASFHRAHQGRYGYAQPANPIEIVTVRLRSSGLVEQRKEKVEKRVLRLFDPKEHGTAYIEGKKIRLGIYEREQLRAGMKLRSPCIVKEYSATTLVPVGVKCEVDSFGNLIIES
jgi:N-methylhydantoinase A